MKNFKILSILAAVAAITVGSIASYAADDMSGSTVTKKTQTKKVHKKAVAKKQAATAPAASPKKHMHKTVTTGGTKSNIIGGNKNPLDHN